MIKKRQYTIDELEANLYTVSAHKYGFFLCRQGTARIMLGTKVYQILPDNLVIYTPNTLFQILERSSDLQGLLEEDDVATYYPAISSINVRRRLQIRNQPCVTVSDIQATAIEKLTGFIRKEETYSDGGTNNEIHAGYISHLKYALGMKILEVYFSNSPIKAMPETRADRILNRFLIELFDKCRHERTVQYYAGKEHLSPYYFSTIIKESSGKSAMEWIENVTMTLARQYLECGDMSIKEVAEVLNFPDQSTFGRYFRQRQGCSPSDYKHLKNIKIIQQ